MAQLIGKWRMESSENFDEYMKAVGVGMLLRKTGNAMKPDTIISQDGDTWKLRTESTFKNTEITFKLGEEFDETTADGRKVKSTITQEGDNKLIHAQKGDVDTTLLREVAGDTLTLTCDAQGVKAIRVYKKV